MVKEKRINIKLYPNKWEELLKKYEYEKAFDEYWKFCRIFSLEKYIIKYGELEGTEKFNKIKSNRKYGMSLEKSILKHGVEKGGEIYEKWKNNVKLTLEKFIKKHGEKLGKEKWEEFKNKAIKNLRVEKNNDTYNTKFEYWIKKYDGNIELAKEEYKKRQTTSTLEKLIEKYGDECGKSKYQEINLKKKNNLENYIIRYGFEDGTMKYNCYLDNLKFIRKKENLIKKNGEEWYKEYIIKKTTRKNKKYSNVAFEFCENLYFELKNDYKKMFYGDNEYDFYVFEDNINIIRVDFYIKDINCVVEFYGDFWHRNPIKFFDEDSENIRKKDERRINKLKEKFGCDVIILWEKDYNLNKIEEVKNIILKIKNLKNGRNC